MAEAVLFNIADGIIAKLGSRVIQEIWLWWGVKDELQNLLNRVSMIKPLLLHAEKQYSENNPVGVWLGMLKEVVYDADDLLDILATQSLNKQSVAGSRLGKEVRLFFSGSNQFASGLYMAHKIKSISKRLDEIAINKTFMLEEHPMEKLNLARITREREQTHSSLPELFIGREDDKMKIMKFLLSPFCESNVSVISIVGIGGMGKTTLAQFILDDEEVKTHFELKLWVCVGENFDVKSVVEKILESVKGTKPENLEMNSLKNQLHGSINAKKYILVLDDVWNQDPKKWFDLMDLLVGGAKGSIIIVTTRSMKVSMIARSIYDHELRGLPDVESWELFKQMAFVAGQVPSTSFEAIGKEIVEKCVGVPLAIKTIGSLLYFKELAVL